MNMLNSHDKEIINDYSSPDELDSLGYAFREIQKIIRLKKNSIYF